MKKTININEKWLFADDKAQTFTEETITLPHVFQSKENIYTLKKTLSCNQDYARIYLEIKECSGTAKVFLNSKELGHHYGSNTCFRFDITDSFLPNEDNEIVITTSNFSSYTGLIGNISLILTDDIHFDLMDYGSSGIFITPQVQGRYADIRIDTSIEGKVTNAITEYSVVDSFGEQVYILQQPASTHSFTLPLTNIKLWSDSYDFRPSIYTLKARIICSETEIVYDSVDIEFGIRNIELVDKEFLLNSNPISIKSVTLNHSISDLNKDITELYQDGISYIQSINANVIKFENGHFCDEFYHLSNLEGMLVHHDLTLLPAYNDSADRKKDLKTYIIELIKQNYNNPSLCFWTLDDSIIESFELQELFYKKLLNTIKKVDKQRFVLDTFQYNSKNQAGYLYDQIEDDNFIKGLISLDKEKSDKYYYYKMLWTDKKLVHICGGDIKNTPNGTIDIKVFSSCGSLSIYINGEHFVDLSSQDNIHNISIPLEIGENRITINSEHNCGDTITVNRLASVVEE